MTTKWQYPFVNLFKYCVIETWMNASKEGAVEEYMDKTIGKKAYRVSGPISACNFIKLPKSKSSNLGLIGRIMYIHIKPEPPKTFVIHIEVLTTDHNIHRVSISNMYKDESKRKGSSVHLPFNNPPAKWCCLAVDVPETLRSVTSSQFCCVKSVQVCASVSVRGVYTSDQKYSVQDMPRDMGVSQVLPASQIPMIWMPAEPSGALDDEDLKRMANWDQATTGSAAAAATATAAATPAPAAAAKTPGGRHSMAATGSKGAATAAPTAAAAAASAAAAPAAAEAAAAASSSDSPVRVKIQVKEAPAPGSAGPTTGSGGDTASVVDQLVPGTDKEHAAGMGAVLEPDPVIELARVNGYSGEFARTLVWPPHSQEVVFASSSAVVAMRLDGSAQRHFLGHTALVCAIVVSADGSLMATGQEGKEPMVRVWELKSGRCLAILHGHASHLSCLDISPDGRALVGVGLDQFARQQIVLWDIVGIRDGVKPEVLTKAHSDHNIKSLKFSAFANDHFMSCGRDNIRMYRIKSGTVRSMAVKIGTPDRRVAAQPGNVVAALGTNIFTDIAFDASANGLMADGERYVYVATASGAVFQINYEKRALECIYQLHVGAINSLVIQDKLAVTGSDDKYLRIWPLDFSDYFLEAEHEAPVTSVGLSPSGLQVAVGTENGSIGLLDIPSHKYATLLRSHVGRVNAVALDPNRPQYCTVSSDGTIRIWDLVNHQQLYEFDAPGEVVTCVAFHPRHHELAAGFDTGKVRVFDVQTTTLVQEHRQHRAAVTDVVYAPDGDRLVSAATDGLICVYDAIQIYLPVKALASGLPPTQPPCVAISPDSQMLAAVASDPYSRRLSLVVFFGATLEPFLRVETEERGFVKLAFGADSRELWAVTADNMLQRFSMSDGAMVQCLPSVHRDPCTALAVDPAGSYVVTGGRQIKVWANLPRSRVRSLDAAPPHQGFVGHPGAIACIAISERAMVSVGEGDAIYVWRVNRAGGASGKKGAAARVAAAHARAVEALPTLASGPGRSPSKPISLLGGRPLHPNPEAAAAAAASPGGSSGSSGPPILGCSSVIGFTPHSGTNVVWHPATGLFAYAVDNVVVLEDLATHAQRYLSYHSSSINCLAVSPDASLLASGSLSVEVSKYAEVVVWDVATGRKKHVLQYHPISVQSLAFSPDGAWLLSVGRDPERAVAVWDVKQGELVALGRTKEAVSAVAWLQGVTPLPEFVSIGLEGVLRWTMQPSFLEQRSLVAAARGAVPTAVACDAAGNVLVADEAGRIVELRFSPSGGASSSQVAHLPGGAVVHVSASADVAVVTSSGGSITRFDRTSSPWVPQGSAMALDGTPLSIAFEPGLNEAVAATSACTIWYVHMGERSKVPLVCAHTAPVASLGAVPEDDGTLMASTARDGLLRVWQFGDQGAEPHAEFASGVPCTCAQVTPDSTLCAAGYSDGSLRLFDIASIKVKWTAPRHGSAVVAVWPHVSSPWLLSASSDGMVCVTDASDAALLVHCEELMGDRATILDDGLGPAVSVGGRLSSGTLRKSMSGLADAAPAPPSLEAFVVSQSGGGAICAAAWRNCCKIMTTPWSQSSTQLLSTYEIPAPELSDVTYDVPAMAQFVPASNKMVAYSSPLLFGKVVLFEYRLSMVLRTIDLPQMVSSMHCSLDGLRMAFGGTQGSVFVVDYETGAWSELTGHVYPVTAMQWLRGSHRLVSASGSTMLVWQHK